MDARKNTTKGLQPREGETRAMQGLDLESVIERARRHDAEALGEIYPICQARLRIVPLHVGVKRECRRSHGGVGWRSDDIGRRVSEIQQNGARQPCYGAGLAA